MIKAIKKFFSRRFNKSEITYSDVKKKFKKHSKSQLIRMIAADQIIIDNMAKEFGVKDVKKYLRKK